MNDKEIEEWWTRDEKGRWNFKCQNCYKLASRKEWEKYRDDCVTSEGASVVYQCCM